MRPFYAATSTMPSRLRCVVDTNVLISAALNPRGLPRRAVQWVVDHGELLLSAPTFDEFASRFILRAKFDRYLSAETRRAFVAEITRNATVVETTSRIAVCSDPDDDRFLELAVDGGAPFVVTGNSKDFPSRYDGVRILTPREFALEVGVE